MTYPTIRKAYRFRESFLDIFSDEIYVTDPENKLNEWCRLVIDSAIEPMVKFVNMIKAHMFGIKTLFEKRNINNGILEGLNSLIQLAKKRARGYVNVQNFKTLIYFVTGKLQLDYPHDSL